MCTSCCKNKKPCVLLTLRFRPFVSISQQTAINFLKGANYVMFILNILGVYYEVRTGIIHLELLS
jgi:hypothetical protein